MFIIILKIIIWVLIFLYTILTVMAIKWAIDEHKFNKKVKSLYEKWTIGIEHTELNTAIITCCFDIAFILYGLCFIL